MTQSNLPTLAESQGDICYSDEDYDKPYTPKPVVIHYYVSYKTKDWAGKTVTQATKVYAESPADAEKKVLNLHPAISEVVQSYDLGD